MRRMSSYETILVPHDLSKTADEALSFAIDLAQALGSRLLLLHVYQRPLELLSPYDISLPDSFVADAREAAARAIEVPAARAREAGVPVEVELTEGLPAEAIVRRAEQIEPDLIVMGCRGLSGLKHVLLGSVAGHVVRSAACPVLTVKQH